MTRSGVNIDNDGMEGSLGEGVADRERLAVESRELGGRLAGLSLPRQVAVLALWPLLEQVLNFTVGFTDMAIAGHLGSAAAIDALAPAGYLQWLVGMMQMAVSVGGSALIARAVGARHIRLANKALGQAVVLGFAWGFVIGAVIFLAAPAAGRAAGLEGDALRFCTTYLRIIACAAPLSGLMLVANACLRGAGDTMTPFVTMLVVNLVNIAASCLLAFGPAPLGGHGVAGIAAGTFAGWAVGAAMSLFVLLRGWGGIRLHWNRLRPDPHTMWRIARIGLPNLAESSGVWIANYLILVVVGWLKVPAALGAHMVVIRVEAISYLPGLALGTAASTLVGQYLGLGDPARARRAALLCGGAGAAIMATMGLAFIAFPWHLVRLATDQPDALRLAPPLLRMTGFIQVFFTGYMVFSQALRGAGDTRTTMLIALIMGFGVRLPLAYFLGHVMGLGLWGIWLGLCSELAVRGTVFFLRFLHGGWVHARV